MIRAVFLLAAVGCGAAIPDSRAWCYVVAETRAQMRVDTECAGVEFAACEAYDSILQQLQREQEACP